MTTLDDSMVDLDEEGFRVLGPVGGERREDGDPVEAEGALQAEDEVAVAVEATPEVEESAARVAPSRWVRETVFREKLRGYHPGDVDAFMDQVAFAFDELVARLHDAEERVSRAAGEAALVVADDETVRRTLTLAQRTAELAITEAERQAAELVERARAESQALVREAEAEAAAIRERERSKLAAELTHLESARAVAAEDLDVLESRRRHEHERLSKVLRDLAEVVEQRLS
ncbi:MAG TPA: DivIVA domain-containing protein [Acidimicrobiales bacterium]|nr:DivIVA domain-containing protein [Acidimicrobiales bacterium]